MRLSTLSGIAFLHGAIASSGDGSTEMDLIKNWFSELSALPKTPLQLQNQIDGRSIDDIDSTDRSCYYCRSTEFVSGQDSVGGDCFIPELLMTTSKKIEATEYGCFTMYGYLKKSGDKVIYRTSAYSKSEENRCKTVNFRDFISAETVLYSNHDLDEQLVYCTMSCKGNLCNDKNANNTIATLQLANGDGHHASDSLGLSLAVAAFTLIIM